VRLWDVFLVHPWLALAIGLAFLLGWICRGRRQSSLRRALAIVPALAWLAYALYEWRMQSWSTTVIAPVRIDLLFVIPALVAVSVVGFVATLVPFHAS
jgi:ABC-type dipeptide/oligopeptide/nickel transport system permease subunit